MKKILTASVLAIGASLVAAPALAQSATGSLNTTTLRNNALGTKLAAPATGPAAATGAGSTELNVANKSLFDALTSADKAAIATYKAAKINEAEKAAAAQAAATKLGVSTTGSETGLELELVNANASVSSKSGAASAAAGSLTNAQTALQNAESQLATEQASSTATQASIAAKQALVDQRKLELAQAQAVSTAANDALTKAQADQAKALAARNAAAIAKTAAQIEASTANAQLVAAENAADTLLASNTALETAIGAYKAVYTGATQLDASIDGLASVTQLTAYVDPTVPNAAAIASSDRRVRNDGLLSAAAASTQSNISRASGALTCDPATTTCDVYEVEVLGALTNHEGRITATEAGVAANTAAIAKETTDRVAADGVLLEKITAETNARVAADNALSTRIGSVESSVAALGNRVGALETRVKQIDDRVDSSAALAMAMGGGGFLPDMKFNLSANVATYNGAQAISASLGVRVTNNVAVTAAFGGGLNKGGKVGGRVGFIVGW